MEFRRVETRVNGILQHESRVTGPLHRVHTRVIGPLHQEESRGRPQDPKTSAKETYSPKAISWRSILQPSHQIFLSSLAGSKSLKKVKNFDTFSRIKRSNKVNKRIVKTFQLK